MVNHYQKAYFLLSVADVKQLPPDQGIEIAIVGRSNSGKSSVLNAITKIKGLARVSKTPGRTRLLNVFSIDENRRLIDLPGYGFAKAPIASKRQWEKTIDVYFKSRKSLRGLVLVMDARHPFKDLDKVLLDFCAQIALPVHILLNKTDKFSKNVLYKTLKESKAVLTQYDNSVSLQGFSALKGKGLPELYTQLNKWYQFNAEGVSTCQAPNKEIPERKR